ncbi:hypothetical protein [Sphingomonas sp. 3-13AW]|uniref:type II secretion system protein GspD n=1 Tax=Sphingomonas sp. 3-13AW TaxID=3050450 RepID=UPI003BB73CF6
MNRVRHFARTSVLAISMASIAISSAASAGERNRKTSTKFAQVVEPTSFAEAERGYDGMFANRPAVQRVRVPGQFFVSKPRDGSIPASLMNKKVEIDIRSTTPRLSDLQTMLEIQGVAMAIDWRSLSNVPDPDAKVGTFTAASRYQALTNSAGGNSGGQNGGGFGGGLGGGLGGGMGGGSYGNGFGGSYGGFGGGMGGSGGGSTPNITIVGSAGGGSSGSSGGGQNGGLAGSGQSQGQADEIPSYPNPQGSGYGRSKDGGEAGDDSKSPRFMDRVLPFRYFSGTVGELVKRLENSGALAVWYDNGLIVGETRRYSVAIMQNIDVSQSVVNELIRLGARDVVGSIGAGQIFYAAPPRVNAEMIEPYLRRVSTNLSEITLQVALVTVAMTKNAERGFDWSAFNLQLGNGTASAGGNEGSLTRNTGNFSNNGFQATFGVGLTNPLSVAGAIRFLSRVGDTSVTQNVELRTLSGAPVALRSGENIPYVQNVGSNIVGGVGGGGISGNTQTASLGTGITLNVDPRYDSSSGIVTMDVGVKLVDLVEFVQLSAGNQVGTLSQPRTREQGLNSIIRVPAGQTTIVGGIRRDQASDTRTAPLGLWGIGSRNRDRNVFWLFTIVRPVVTVFETSDVPNVPKSVLDTTVTVNPSDDRPVWPKDQYRVDQPVITQGAAAVVQEVPGGYVPRAQVLAPVGAPSTPPNRQPAAVVISQPPAPRNVVVGAPSSPPEVTTTAAAPANTVVRLPVAPSATSQIPGNRVTLDGAAVNLPLAPAPADEPRQPTVPTQPTPPATVVPSGKVQAATAAQAEVVAQSQPAVRTFLRPMTDAERKGSN